VSPPDRNLSPSQAATRLGVSIKALRLYERQGLITPGRTRAGWRAYAPAEMGRAAEIVSLRKLGLSLTQIARVLGGEPGNLGEALAAHEARLLTQSRQIAESLDRVRRLRLDVAGGHAPALSEVACAVATGTRFGISFALPWPWGGECFEVGAIGPLTYLTGPLGSGKTRLAMRMAEALPDARFVGLERLVDDGEAALSRLAEDRYLQSRVARSLDWLVGEGATGCRPLIALLAALEAEEPTDLVIDMVEQGLDQATQEALIAHLRLRSKGERRLILLTRSSSILNLDAVGPGEAIIYCPANHSPPLRVAPHPASPGYEAVATCLTSPEVRARTAGIIVMRPSAAIAETVA
jgi:DNA-binding transcriptional MerR regulator